MRAVGGRANKFIVYEGFGVLEIDKTAQDIPGILQTIKERIVDNKISKQIEKVQINESAFIALKSENPIFFKKMKKAFEERGVIPIQPDAKVGICFVPHKARPKLVNIIKTEVPLFNGLIFARFLILSELQFSYLCL